ncbi:MAG: DUF1559 domain-containing protein [Pirellulaceae bacterium]
MHNRNRRAFTLVELLVVIAIIGVLVALLLPAVQAAREAARRTSCMNNLKQLGIAIQNYHDSTGKLPLQNLANPAKGWGYFLLPFIEHQTLSDRYESELAWTHIRNQPAITTFVDTYMCASAPGHRGGRMDNIGRGRKAAASDYAPPGSVSLAPIRAGLIFPAPGNTGGSIVPRGNLNLKLRDLIDGTSTTIGYVEDSGRPQHWIVGRKRGPSNSPPGGGNLSVRRGRVRGAGWADTAAGIPLHGFTKNGRRAPGPCPINCTNNNEAFSFHPGGVQAAMCDGSVQFLHQNMSMNVYAALITRAGTEPITTGIFKMR